MAGPMQPQPVARDPVQTLMEEYDRLEAQSKPKPMYSPEEQQQRIQENQGQVDIGMLGAMSGDSRIRGAGGSVLKQALGNRQEQVTQRGAFNPLTGEERLSPEYQNQQLQNRRTNILQRAMGFQQQRDMAEMRNNNARDLAELKAELKSKGGSDGPKYNMQRVLNEQTGEWSWVDPRTMQNLGPVRTETGEPNIKPDVMTSPDEKAMSEVIRGAAATQSALSAVQAHPNAFGMKKGMANLPGGATGTILRAARDKGLTPEQIQARAAVYNNVSQIIKERAGTAQSAGELARLNSFLPSDLDGAPQIEAKLKGFEAYLREQDAAIKSKYKGQRPVKHVPGSGNQPAAPAAPTPGRTRMRYNPVTGDLEPVNAN